MAVVNDFQLNAVGMTFALLNMCITAWYQIRVSGAKAALGLNSQQLLMNMIDACAVIATCVAPLLDNWGLYEANAHSLIYFEWSTGVIFAIAGSAVLSVGVNLAILMLLGATSAVTYNVVGHFKTVLILSGSWIMLGYPLDAKNLGGIAIALVGMILYTRAKLSAQPAPAPAPQATEEEKSSLLEEDEGTEDKRAQAV